MVQDPIPTLASAIKDGLVGIFRNGYSYFNNVLWTMRIELVGSLCVYAFFQVCRRQREVGAGVAVVALVVFGVPAGYVAFALGACLSLALERGLRLPQPAALPVFALGLLIGAAGRGFADRHGFGAWPAAWRPGEVDGLTYLIGALAVVVGLLGSGTLQRFFERPVCQWLGRLSFPLYLVHVPLLYTVVAAAAVHFGPLSANRIAALGVAFLAASFALARIFEAAVDRPVLALNRRLAIGPRRRQ